MTIKQLLGFGVTEDPVLVLESMTDEQLREHCAPYIKVVELREPPKEQPELAVTATEPKVRKPKTADDWLREVAALQRKHGVVAGIGELPREIKKG